MNTLIPSKGIIKTTLLIFALNIAVVAQQNSNEVQVIGTKTASSDTLHSIKKTNSVAASVSSNSGTYDSTLSYVKKEIKIIKFYTRPELSKIQKLHLRDIYKNRLTYIIEVFPFLSLNQDPGATLFEMGIPESEANVNHLQKEIKNKQAFIKSLFVTLNDVLPYSDKERMISTILFFDEIIKLSMNIHNAEKK